MKLLCLNLWAGRVYDPLIKFLKDQNDKIDIFCFQEITNSSQSKFSRGIKTDLFSDISAILKNYTGFLATPILDGYDLKDKVDFDLPLGQATFVRKNIEVVAQETLFIYGKNAQTFSAWQKGRKNYLDVPRNVHCVTVREKEQDILIGNLHGFWLPKSKTDNRHRIIQSLKIKKIFDSFEGPKLLCGDFNLHPDTQSIKMIEENMMNLIKEYKIKGTRSNLHKRKVKFADYIFVSSQIKINKFEVMSLAVSDHLPLYLDFSI